MLGQLRRRWAIIGPALGQRLVFARSVNKPHYVLHIGVVPKRNNKFRLIDISTIHMSHLITLITKAMDTTSISYQSLWLCSWKGDESLVFCLQKPRPF